MIPFRFQKDQITRGQLDQIINLLKTGKVGVLPSDTLYGIHGIALLPQTIKYIYQIRKRSPSKPFIILISSLHDLAKFGIAVSKEQKSFLSKIWPNQISVVLPCSISKLAYLHRGTNTLAFRYPKSDFLIDILNKTGPLISTTVNFEGEPPAKTIDQALEVFGDNIDFYIDAGKLESPPSTLIEIKDDKIITLRQGRVNIDNLKLS